MKAIKQLFLNALLLPGVAASLRHARPDGATIFMLHRFRDPGNGIEGYEAAQLRRVLSYLVANGYELIDLVELFDRLAGNGPALRGAVAFTIDDGYADQATVAAPVFAEFKCPVTTFVSTGFLDGKIWFWWDQIEYVFELTDRLSVEVRLGDSFITYQWETVEQRGRAQADFIARCKLVPDEQKWAAISMLAGQAEVELPPSPPPRYSPMSWDQVRACESMGMTFGPHTVTHPILSRTLDKAAEFEIEESWTRLCAEAKRPVPVFCYPNGGWGDFGEREIEVLRRLGFRGALVGEPGYALPLTDRDGKNERFRVRRYSLPDDLPHTIQYVCGMEALKQAMRRSG